MRPTVILHLRIYASFCCATVALIAVCLVPGSLLAKIALLTSSVFMTLLSARGNYIQPTVILGLFAPLRLLGSFIANDLLVGQLRTVGFAVSNEAVYLAAVTSYIITLSTVALMAHFSVPGVLPPHGLTKGGRQAAALIFILATVLFVARAGTVPILQNDAESSRVTAQAGSAFLVFAAFASGLLLAIDTAVRRHHRQIRSAFALAVVTGLVVLLLSSASRLPAIVTLYAYVATSVTLSRAAGRPIGLQVSAALASIISLAAVVGAARASYVGFGAGAQGASEHLLRRVAADGGNLTLLLERGTQSIITTSEFVTAPFVTYWPGPQRNLGQLLKDRLGLEFQGGGITVPMPAESFGLFGWTGLILIPVITAAIAALYDRVMAASDCHSAIYLAAGSYSFIALGVGGIFEFLGSSLIPIVVMAALAYMSGRVLDQMRATAPAACTRGT